MNSAPARETIFATARLRAVPVTLDDLDFMAEMLSHPEVMRYYPKLYSRVEAQGWIERQQARYQRDGHGLWRIETLGGGEMVGLIGLAMQELEGARHAEVGYLLHRPFWKQGFAEEAARGTLQWAFEVKGESRVICLIRPANTPSQAVARRLGMTVRRQAMFHGYLHDLWQVDRIP